VKRASVLPCARDRRLEGKLGWLEIQEARCNRFRQSVSNGAEPATTQKAQGRPPNTGRKELGMLRWTVWFVLVVVWQPNILLIANAKAAYLRTVAATRVIRVT
jgi:hypothetical protein